MSHNLIIVEMKVLQVQVLPLRRFYLTLHLLLLLWLVPQVLKSSRNKLTMLLHFNECNIAHLLVTSMHIANILQDLYKVGSILYYFHIQFPNSEKCLHHNKYTKKCIVCRRFNEIRHLPFSTAVGATGFPQGFVFGNGASTKFLLSKIFGFGTSVFWVSSACWVLSLVEEVFELFIGLLSVSKLVAIGGCASTCEVSTLIVTETEFISTDAAMPSSCIHKPYLAKVKPAILNMHPKILKHIPENAECGYGPGTDNRVPTFPE